MAISAVANSGPQPPTLASLLQINRINPVTGRDSDDAKEVSGALLPKVSAKQPVIPKLVQDVLKTLSQMGADLSGSKAEGVTGSGAQAKEVKKSVTDFLTSVIAAIKPQGDSANAKTTSLMEQLNAGISKMIGDVSGGASVDPAVAQNARKLLYDAGLPSNANTLGGLLEGLQKSLLDGSSTGSLINATA